MPERIIWRVGIALHCLPRILIMPYVLHKHFRNTLTGRRYNLTTWWFGPLNLLNSLLHLVENGALLTLTYISSKENFGKALNCFLFSYVRNRLSMSELPCAIVSKRMFVCYAIHMKIFRHTGFFHANLTQFFF